MKLTDNFSLKEMTRSATAEKKNIENVPNEEQIECLRQLCVNILATTGYCMAQNKAGKGSKAIVV